MLKQFTKPVITILFVIVPGVFTSAVNAAELMSGEQVFKTVCFACHATKVDKAPQLHDEGSWANLIKEGQYVVTAHGWVGVRGMPAKGGRPDLKLEEFARATAYMARSGGADWKDPDAEAMAIIKKEVIKREAELKTKK